jgi:lipoyl(octanoyl) transferase
MDRARAFEVVDLGRLAYAPALERQLECVDRVLADRDAMGENRDSAGFLLLVEHDPPVITVSRRAAAAQHLLASTAQLDRLGIEVAPTDRGGDITYHGPGQLVAYPILDLNLLGLRLHEYMRLLEEAVIGVCAGYRVCAMRDPSATGVWIPDAQGAPSRKIGAMGVRVKRWVSMHGLALTSLARELGESAPTMAAVKSSLVEQLDRVFGARLSRGSSAPDPAQR